MLQSRTSPTILREKDIDKSWLLGVANISAQKKLGNFR